MTPIHSFVSSTLLAEVTNSPTNLLGRPEVLMVTMVIMFYFLLIRPQQRQKKELAARIASLQSGEKVVTSSGIHGIIQNVKDNTVMIKVAEGITLEFDKSVVAIVQKKEVPAAK